MFRPLLENVWRFCGVPARFVADMAAPKKRKCRVSNLSTASWNPTKPPHIFQQRPEHLI